MLPQFRNPLFLACFHVFFKRAVGDLANVITVLILLRDCFQPIAPLFSYNWGTVFILFPARCQQRLRKGGKIFLKQQKKKYATAMYKPQNFFFLS